ncbi:LysR family transcriptional regulator [Duganella callida]|uniref:LysR family transcriptional regulator n=1 Tax=Duganella callida TaxID=2561932 RepID=A0A4Y9SAX4_9BURK|nr:LysR family transcriptional regulator [Duganella callida]TFW18845.1 LysR family transcriptional regulator [Duganella callida]
MRDPGLPSLDQLRVFIAVIDHGGFAHAARALHRTQSVISYTIANLEEQLNVALLDRSKRKPTLTEAGKALLADARAVSLKVDGMRARAKALSAGLEAEVSLVVDVMFSTCKLVRILHAFQKEFPTVSMRLRTEALGAVTQLVMNKECHIGISGWMPGTPDVIERQACGFVTMVPVVAPDHPLAQIEGQVPSAILREHTQLVLTDRSPLTKGQDFGVLALRDWRLGDLSSKHALLRNGIGWGNMPLEFVQWDLDAGRLVQLEIAEGSSFSFPLYVIRRGDEEPGPATRWLMQQFLDLAQSDLHPMSEREAAELAAHKEQMAAQAHAYHALIGKHGDAEAAAEANASGGISGRAAGKATRATASERGPRPPAADAPAGLAVAAPISLRPR